MSRCETTRVAGDRPAEPAGFGNSTVGGGADERSQGGHPARGLPLKLAAIYGRVSTDKQEREETVQSQLAALRRVWRKPVGSRMRRGVAARGDLWDDLEDSNQQVFVHASDT